MSAVRTNPSSAIKDRTSGSAAIADFEAMSAKFHNTPSRSFMLGVFHSLVDLQAAINRSVAETNLNPKPFVWTADPDGVLAAVKRGKQALGRSTS